MVRFEPKPFGCQTEPLPLHSECLCTVLPILSIYSQLGYIGFPPPQLTTCPAMYTKKVIGLYISVSTRLVPYTICLMNSPPIGCTNSQHTVCSPTECVIGYSAPTGNWRVKLGNGKRKPRVCRRNLRIGRDRERYLMGYDFFNIFSVYNS